MTVLLGREMKRFGGGGGGGLPQPKGKGFSLRQSNSLTVVPYPEATGHPGFCYNANSPFLMFREEHFMEHKSLVLHPVTANGD